MENTPAQIVRPQKRHYADVLGINKIAEMRLRLDMAFVVMPPDGPRFDCAVHAVNLPYVQGYAGWVSRCPMPFSVQIMSTRMARE